MAFENLVGSINDCAEFPKDRYRIRGGLGSYVFLYDPQKMEIPERSCTVHKVFPEGHPAFTNKRIAWIG